MAMRRVLCGSTLILLLLGAAGYFGPVLADEPNQAALVIQFDKDRVETRCISFEGDTIAGDELLADSGLDLIIDASGGMGITLCRVEDVGCAFPSEHCFCQCMGGGPCAYWNYFYRDPADQGWVYSALGAVLRKAKPGSVEAWVWGDGHTPPSDDLTFEAICTPATAAAPTPTLESHAQLASSPPVTTPEAVPTPAAVQASTPLPTISPTRTAAPPTVTPSPSPVADATPEPSTYWPFGLVVLCLALIGAIAWLRRA
jgi:hypothetical protein